MRESPGAGWRLAAGLACAGLGLVLLGMDVLTALAPEPWAATCRAALGAACHQDPARSLTWAGMPLGSCARCVGLHAGALAGGGLLALAARRHEGWAWRVAFLSTVPLVVDAVLGMAVPAWDHPPIRVVTGFVFIAGVVGVSTLVGSRRPGDPTMPRELACAPTTE